MNSILQILRSTHQQSTLTIAKLLSIAESEYEKLEAGTTALSLEHAFVLAKFYNIEIGDLIPAGDVNYNTGALQQSRNLQCDELLQRRLYFITKSEQ